MRVAELRDIMNKDQKAAEANLKEQLAALEQRLRRNAAETGDATKR